MTKLPKIYKHGIEITNPWNHAMYEYNDIVRAHMIKEIRFCINKLQDVVTADKLAKIINPYSYSSAFTLEEMKADMLKNANNFENYWLAEIWDELIAADFVIPNFGEGNEVFHIIGFEHLRKKFT